MKPVEAMRRALAELDGTIEPWADHHFREEATDALGTLAFHGCLVVEDSFNGLAGVARKMLEENYPADLFGEGAPFGADVGSRFTQHLRRALAELAPTGDFQQQQEDR